MPNNKLNDDLLVAPVFQLPYPAKPYLCDTDPQTDEFPSLTKQADAESCDINNIVAQYLRTGLLPQHPRSGFYADLSSLPDYQSALQIVIDAQNAFDELPADLRARFANDPATFVEFCSDPKNEDELVRLGILAPNAPPAEAPQELGEGEGGAITPPVSSKPASTAKKTASTEA